MEQILVGVTMGDPAGVGPELSLRILSDPGVSQICTPVVFGDHALLLRVAGICRFDPPRTVLSLSEWQAGAVPDRACVVDCGAVDASAVRVGEIDALCGQASADYFKLAVGAAIEGRLSAVVTNPINKQAWRRAGMQFPGHTEWIAALTGTRDFCMMLLSDELKLSFVTTHLGISEVAENLTIQRILTVLRLTAEALRRLGTPVPRLGVCGLNPHAGEGGQIGRREEEEMIVPALSAARQEGLEAEGPLSPDTAFIAAIRNRYDALVCMYHDQGHIPFKMMAFDKGVNVTLGLPIVRTSVDHGTAFDIAWQGKASPRSLIQAIAWAVRLRVGC